MRMDDVYRRIFELLTELIRELDKETRATRALRADRSMPGDGMDCVDSRYNHHQATNCLTRSCGLLLLCWARSVVLLLLLF